MTDHQYTVEVRKGWSYVVGGSERSGPWRYEWEAQEEADRLNGQANGEEPNK
jgi:hypothetical protein